MSDCTCTPVAADVDYEVIYTVAHNAVIRNGDGSRLAYMAGLAAVVAAAKVVAFVDAVDWARAQSGGSADVAADYIELAAAIQEQDEEGTP